MSDICCCVFFVLFVFVKQKTAYEMRISDWSSDVCSSDLIAADRSEGGRLRGWANVVGVTGSPFDAWLTLRGLRTLFARMERQQRNAGLVAAWLEAHPAVSAVHYPGDRKSTRLNSSH